MYSERLTKTFCPNTNLTAGLRFLFALILKLKEGKLETAFELDYNTRATKPPPHWGSGYYATIWRGNRTGIPYYMIAR